ncbi:MAG TPA: glycosyltransferase family 2 protein [Candidatus Saccharimonadales bacterium]
MQKVAVVVPNWNGMDSIKDCLDSLLGQTLEHSLIVVENGSSDGSLAYLRENYPEVKIIVNQTNLGFAAGVNSGIKFAIENGAKFVALFNNDAVADKRWLEYLYKELEVNDDVGIATCKLVSADNSHLDSTGDFYTNWGLPFPRGRGETDLNKYDKQTEIFGASGGASLYRVSVLKEIGLFDEDFFAYYEDVDISFRAQLAGWRVRFVPSAVAYHQIGATSGKIRGFTTYHSMKNLPLLLFKNVPRKYFWTIAWRFKTAYIMFYLRSITRGNGWSATKGLFRGYYLVIKKIGERKKIQSSKKVTDEYIWGMIVHDLPPNAKALRKIRLKWWKLTGKSAK